MVASPSIPALDPARARRLETLAPGLWAAQHDLFLPGGVHFRGRMSVVRLDDGGLALVSPIPIDDALAREIDALGAVRHLVSPCLFHHVHLSGARERYPDARLYAPPGLARKRPDLSIDVTLGTDAARDALGPGLEHVLIEGAPRAAEVCFFHPASRSLLVGDLVFNIHEYRGFVTGLVLRAVGAHRRLAPSRSWRGLVQDRASVRRSLERVLTWDFDRLVVAHGEVVESGAREKLTAALGWLLAA